MKRKTSQRSAIVKAFEREKRPLGIDEILRIGQKHVPSLNQATVYRNLKTMIEDGEIQAVVHPDVGTLYETSGKTHHHFFHCRVCDRVYDLQGCALNEKKAAPSGYVVETHEVFLSGVCPVCSE